MSLLSHTHTHIRMYCYTCEGFPFYYIHFEHLTTNTPVSERERTTLNI
uniref:Uncharacterized protein n=1 Tax=Anguilla anguilla TaxID=7936 RepID=A0A0E9UUK9_ANGAN